MPEVLFYQTNRGQEIVLCHILRKSRDAGWRVLLRGTKQDRIDFLDDFLWKFPEEGFLPHGLAGGDYDEMQPILLTTGNEAPETRETLVLIDGAKTSAKEVETVKRVSIVFESRDREVVGITRAQWKTLKEKEIPLVYWSEEEGGWTKKAST